MKGGVDLVLGPGALANQRRPAGDPPAQRPGGLVGDQTDSSIPAPSSRASVRASKRSDFTRAEEIALTSAELTTTTRETWGRTIRATSIAAPVASRATWSSLPRLWAKSSSCSLVVLILPAERTSPASAIATSQKLGWTSSAIDRMRSSFRSVDFVRNAVGKRQLRIRARGATGLVAGAAT